LSKSDFFMIFLCIMFDSLFFCEREKRMYHRGHEVALYVLRQKEKEDYYGILKISRSAIQDDIKRAYDDMARRLHPEQCNHPKAALAFKHVLTANTTLADPEKRKIYDRDGIKPKPGGFAQFLLVIVQFLSIVFNETFPKFFKKNENKNDEGENGSVGFKWAAPSLAYDKILLTILISVVVTFLGSTVLMLFEKRISSLKSEWENPSQVKFFFESCPCKFLIFSFKNIYSFLQKRCIFLEKKKKCSSFFD
jgi:curved DNA-binding protein CbpA